MPAWKAQVNSAAPVGSNLAVNVTYYLSTDTNLTTPLGTDVVVVPATLSPANIQKQIQAQAGDYRNSYNLIATYQGTVINVP